MRYLAPNPVQLALANADDELRDHAWGQDLMAAGMKMGVHTRMHALGRPELTGYFSEVFQETLRQRLRSISSDDLKTLYKGFESFRRRLGAALREAKGDSVDPKSILPLPPGPEVGLIVAKILRQAIGSTQLTEDLARVADPGSAIYFLELYAMLCELNHLARFESWVGSRTTRQIARLYSTPMLMVDPWDHQREAIARWERGGRRGIVEMATGTGKTLVGLMAAQAIHAADGRVTTIILAHSNAILAQWRDQVQAKLGLPAVGSVGSDFVPDIFLPGPKIRFRFLTYQRVMRAPGSYSADLLIADEVHHASAPQFREALKVPAEAKLGLSATIDGKEKLQVLFPHLGPRVFTLSLKDAIEKGILPRFEWKIHGVSLELSEQREYENASKRISTLLQHVRSDPAVLSLMAALKHGRRPPADIGEALRVAEQARLRKHLRVPDSLGELRNAVFARRWILHDSSPKLQSSVELAAKYGRDRMVVMFTMSIDACERIVSMLEANGIEAWAVHSELAGGSKEITSRIQKFKRAGRGVLVAPKLLDEGVDIPAAEVGINVSASRTRLQLVQRIGRILRKQEGKKPIFHHFASVTSAPDPMLQIEDTEALLDEISWVQDTALQLGVVPEVVRDRDVDLKGSLAEAELRVAERVSEVALRSRARLGMEELKAVPGFGSIRLGFIVQSIPADPRARLLKLLDGKEATLDDNQWARLLCEAHGQPAGSPLAIPGHWWLLVAGSRKPRRIAELIEVCAGT